MTVSLRPALRASVLEPPERAIWVRPHNWQTAAARTVARCEPLRLSPILVANDAAAPGIREFAPYRDPARMMEAMRPFGGLGRVDLMLWAVPSSAYCTGLVRYVDDLRSLGWSGRLQLDAEESWQRHTRDGWQRCADILASAAPDSVTTYPGILRTSALEILLGIRSLTACYLQAYATTTSGTTPGGVQRFAGSVWGKAPASERLALSVALPLYRQEGAGKLRARDSLRVQHEAALAVLADLPEAQRRGISWWSSVSLSAPVVRRHLAGTLGV
jgi:hypothetical protein